MMGKSQIVTATPTVQAAAYASGNVVGGILSFSQALDADLSGVLQSAALRLKIPSTVAFTLWLFSASPDVGVYADKTAPVWSDSDLSSLLGAVSFASSAAIGDMAIYEANGIGKVIRGAYTTLYGVLVAGGAVTFVSTADVLVDLGILKD